MSEEPTFERCAGKVLGEAISLFQQRGGEYADSFHVDNMVTTFTEATLRLCAEHEINIYTDKEWIRLLQLAAIVDLKDARMIGPFKMDTVVDGINYRAVWGQLAEEFLAAHKPS